MARIQAVLFDMDGVLIEAKDWHYETLNKALRQFGMEITRKEHLTAFDGLPTKKKLQMLTERGEYIPASLNSFINDLKQSYTMEEVTLKCFPVFQHEYALSRLHAEGYKIALCSNSVRRTIEYMMDRAGLTPYLDLILSNQDVTKPKPDPEIYLTAMERFRVRPEECLIVEDNFNGIQAALASGGNLMKVETTMDVSYENICGYLADIEGSGGNEMH